MVSFKKGVVFVAGSLTPTTQSDQRENKWKKCQAKICKRQKDVTNLIFGMENG
jgi:hypothetical protein